MIAIAATVLNALWQDALLVVAVWLVLHAWPRINAATRYAVWIVTLLAATRPADRHDAGLLYVVNATGGDDHHPTYFLNGRFSHRRHAAAATSARDSEDRLAGRDDLLTHSSARHAAVARRARLCSPHGRC